MRARRGKLHHRAREDRHCKIRTLNTNPGTVKEKDMRHAPEENGEGTFESRLSPRQLRSNESD